MLLLWDENIDLRQVFGLVVPRDHEVREIKEVGKDGMIGKQMQIENWDVLKFFVDF